ncbi:MAG: hypothetical protein Q9226_009401 [Calogaya cf. arnoldii]
MEALITSVAGEVAHILALETAAGDPVLRPNNTVTCDPNYWREHRSRIPQPKRTSNQTFPGISPVATKQKQPQKQSITAWWCCKSEQSDIEHMNDTTEKFDVRCRECKHVFCERCEITRNSLARGEKEAEGKAKREWAEDLAMEELTEEDPPRYEDLMLEEGDGEERYCTYGGRDGMAPPYTRPSISGGGPAS